MSEPSTPSTSQESDSQDTPDSDAAQLLGELGAGNGLGAGEGEAPGPVKERSSAVAPSRGASSIIKATRTEQYFHLQLQLVHLERVLALLATSHDNDIKGTEAIADFKELQPTASKYDIMSAKSVKLEGKYVKYRDLWRQTRAEIGNARLRRGVRARLTYWKLVLIAEYLWKRTIRAYAQLSESLDERQSVSQDLLVRERALALNLSAFLALKEGLNEKLSEEVLRLVILSKGP
ncbi:hypothetical protein RQP46_005288 [Phenoliferia psychrophenolica]